MYRIGVVAPGGPLRPEVPEAVAALAASLYPDRVELVFHPQCFFSAGHFAGDDAERAAAFIEVANDPDIDAIWFGRGGYGSGRIVDLVLPALAPAAREKSYLGYSDAGILLSALYIEGFPKLAHGPMAQDIVRPGGEAAAARALAYLVDGARASLEPSVDGRAPTAAFNIAILSALIGTPWQPDLAGHVLMLEEVAEHMYRIDRFLFHITSNPRIREVAGIRLGRFTAITPNDPDFGVEELGVISHWCERSGIPYLGLADIGHDADNKVVPFGL